MPTYNKYIRHIAEYASAFIFGGVMYGALETIFRGFTHPSMLITGGLCFAGLYAIDKRPALPLFWRVIIGALLITSLELIAGCICNLWLGWNVWDYSHLHPNLWGQICLPFSLLWAVLTIPAYLLASVMRGAVCGFQSASETSSPSDESP